jgi:hypothetical protein
MGQRDERRDEKLPNRPESQDDSLRALMKESRLGRIGNDRVDVLKERS